MYHRITHEIISPDALSKVTYTYVNLDALDWTLDHIAHYARATKRHGWKVVKSWSRLNPRHNTMEREEPGDAVKDALRDAIMDGLTIN